MALTQSVYTIIIFIDALLPFQVRSRSRDKHLLASSCLSVSVRMYHLGSHRTNLREIWCWIHLLKSVWKIDFLVYANCSPADAVLNLLPEYYITVVNVYTSTVIPTDALLFVVCDMLLSMLAYL